MNDEGFHLTPVDVRRYDFGTALRGYDKARVDQLREQVADELERLSRVNQELEAKAKGFHEQLRAFRERDKALNDALISAQQLRAETKEQAEREAQLTLREAHAEAERLVEEARAEVRRLRAELDALDRSRRTHIAQMRTLAERHLAELAATESADAAAANEAPAAGGDGEAHAKGRKSGKGGEKDSWLDTKVEGE
ncbi:MAG: DivIVA domain-containing protein [Gemmatimonadetes bacterium]|nr:DivIVA domain-containing protein [Gemmatimonadota bacterium]